MPEWRDLHSPWNLHLWCGVDWSSMWNRCRFCIKNQLYTKCLSQLKKAPVSFSVGILIHCNWACLFFIYSLIFPFSAIDCGDPGTPTNGQRSLSSTTYNSVVTYTCDVGYTLQGSNSRTCQFNGQWNGSVPQCSSELEIQGSIFWGEGELLPQTLKLPPPHPNFFQLQYKIMAWSNQFLLLYSIIPFHSLQPPTVVILVFLQMANAASPVQPTTL